MKVEAAKIASTSSKSAFCLPDRENPRKSDLLEVEVLQYSYGIQGIVQIDLLVSTTFPKFG